MQFLPYKKHVFTTVKLFLEEPLDFEQNPIWDEKGWTFNS